MLSQVTQVGADKGKGELKLKSRSEHYSKCEAMFSKRHY